MSPPPKLKLRSCCCWRCGPCRHHRNSNYVLVASGDVAYVATTETEIAFLLLLAMRLMPPPPKLKLRSCCCWRCGPCRHHRNSNYVLVASGDVAYVATTETEMLLPAMWPMPPPPKLKLCSCCFCMSLFCAVTHDATTAAGNKLDCEWDEPSLAT